MGGSCRLRRRWRQRCGVAVTLSWDDIARWRSQDKAALKRHGLDKPLKRRKPELGGRTGNDWREIERQIRYISVHWMEMPKGVFARQACYILNHFIVAQVPPTDQLGYMFEQILGARNDPVKGAKKPLALISARDYIEENPSATNADIAREVGVHPSAVGRWKKRDLL